MSAGWCKGCAMCTNQRATLLKMNTLQIGATESRQRQPAQPHQWLVGCGGARTSAGPGIPTTSSRGLAESPCTPRSKILTTPSPKPTSLLAHLTPRMTGSPTLKRTPHVTTPTRLQPLAKWHQPHRGGDGAIRAASPLTRRSDGRDAVVTLQSPN